MGGKKSGASKMKVTRYLMSIHVGICLGKIDKLLEVLYDDKPMWVDGENLAINKPDLMGGDSKEGGVVGIMDVNLGLFTGSAFQALRNRITSPYGIPGFRGIAQVFLHGRESGGRGFEWGCNNPYLKNLAFRVARVPTSLGTANAYIERPFRDRVARDANPAHVIYEVLTSTRFGAEASASRDIDVASFKKVARTLHTENFGISLTWSAQTSSEDFVNQVLEHINAVLFSHPRTGKMTLTLLRDDYNRDALREFGPDDAELESFSRKGLGETINEVVVTWTDPENEEEKSVTLANDANIAMQGAVSSTAKSYVGVRSQTLAWQLAERELKSAGAPLCSATLSLKRKGWDLVPGEVIAWTWPELGIDRLPMRILAVDYGKPGSSKITLSLLEDIFAVTTGSYGSPQDTEWVSPNKPPEPISDSVVFSVPAFFINAGGFDTLSEITFPEEYVGLFAARPNTDTASYDLLKLGVNAAGNPEFISQGSRIPTDQCATLSPLPSEASSVVQITDMQTGSELVGGFARIGDGPDSFAEWCLIEGYDPVADTLTLRRGCLDTVPRRWPVFTPIRILTTSSIIYDDGQLSAYSTASYKLLSYTSLGRLPVGNAPVLSKGIEHRVTRPLRPANVKINGVGYFGEVDAEGLPTVTLTWANRNRLVEDVVATAWDAGSAGLEQGQTTKIGVLSETGEWIDLAASDLTDTSYNLDLTPYIALGHSAVIVRVLSERDGFDSLQYMEFFVRNFTSPVPEDAIAEESGGSLLDEGGDFLISE